MRAIIRDPSQGHGRPTHANRFRRYNPAMTPTAIEPHCEPAQLSVIVGEIETDLARRVEALDIPEALRAAIRYAMLGGGKRLRPILTLLACEAVGGRRDDARAAAAALELVHTFSLVHDDLPAMDDDEIRRGRPTLHVHCGEALAILAGDAMLSIAFEWIAEASIPDGRKSQLNHELAAACTRMIAGQVYDTIGGFPSGRTGRQRLQLIHRNKTAALLRAACRIGAICGNATPQIQHALSDFGQAVGMMFQIVDDLLDITQSAEHTGKATGKDERAGKLTFPAVHGTEESKHEVRRLRLEAHHALEPLGEAAQSLLQLCDYMAVRTR